MFSSTYSLYRSLWWLTILGRWQPSRKKFFLPIRVISRKFRGKFLAQLKLLIPYLDQSLLNLCYRKEWVVYCKSPFKDAACVVEYLGRYTHRVAISNNRILKIENGAVTFKWRDYRDHSRWKVMTLSADDFIRRFMMHVLPAGFTKIRHYGFLSSRGKQSKLKVCKVQTGMSLRRKEKLFAEQLIQNLIGRNPSHAALRFFRFAQNRSCSAVGMLETSKLLKKSV